VKKRRRRKRRIIRTKLRIVDTNKMGNVTDIISSTLRETFVRALLT